MTGFTWAPLWPRPDEWIKYVYATQRETEKGRKCARVVTFDIRG